MVKYIIFPEYQTATDLITQINTCMGYPSDGTTTWMVQPDPMCEYNLETGVKIEIGYGVIIKDVILGCLTPEQIAEVFALPSNINVCEWQPVSGETQNYFTQFFSGQTNN